MESDFSFTDLYDSDEITATTADGTVVSGRVWYHEIDDGRYYFDIEYQGKRGFSDSGPLYDTKEHAKHWAIHILKEVADGYQKRN